MQSTLKDFVEFMQTSFGILAGITAFFPFVNLLKPLIPFPKPIRQISVASSSIACAFGIYFVFSLSKNNNISEWVSLILFIIGILSLLFIMVVATSSGNLDEEDVIDMGCLSPLLILCHILTFACITSAFSILAANDFWSSRSLGV